MASEQCNLFEITACKHSFECDEDCKKCDVRDVLGSKMFLNDLASCRDIVCERMSCPPGQKLLAAPMECCPTCHKHDPVMSAPTKHESEVDKLVHQVDSLVEDAPAPNFGERAEKLLNQEVLDEDQLLVK